MNLPLRGDQEELGNPANGNFLGHVELMAKCGAVLNEHFQPTVKPGRLVKYLITDIQNKITSIISNEIIADVKNNILGEKTTLFYRSSLHTRHKSQKYISVWF